MQKTAFALAAALLFSAGSLHAQSIWKWRDANGQIHISDTAPPTSVPAKDILQRPGGSAQRVESATPAGEAATAPASAPSVDTELQKKRKQAEQEKADKAKAEQDAAAAKNAQLKAENCRRAQEQVRSLESGQRITRTDEKGERYYLDDAQRAAEVRNARDMAARNCAK